MDDNTVLSILYCPLERAGVVALAYHTLRDPLAELARHSGDRVRVFRVCREDEHVDAILARVEDLLHNEVAVSQPAVRVCALYYA